MTRIFKIDASLNDIQLRNFYKYAAWHEYYRYFILDAGQEHYKLLAHLSSQCHDGETVVDIGTHVGYSALAMAYNPKVHVLSYDLYDHFTKPREPSARDVSNITFLLKNCLQDVEQLAKTPFIFLDVDPHDGIQERDIINAVAKAGFKGIMVCDDIYKSDEMRDFWNWVPYKKFDISKYGHWSGTGIIVFDEKEYDVEIA
jgi:predicted O-methyltransferase YrrM